MTILHSTSQNELCGLTERFVGYVVWVFRSRKGGLSRVSLGQGWMLPSTSFSLRSSGAGKHTWRKLNGSVTRAVSGGDLTAERLSGQTKPIASSSTTTR